MKILAIIPARGGSKRIPQKNIRDFHNSPIISYAINTAIKTELFEEIMVSTDDELIKKISFDFGAKVPFLRSDKNSSDFATTMDVIIEVLNNYKKTNKQYDYACCIYPCTPLLKPKLLKEAFVKLQNQNFDLVFPVVKYSFPIQRALKIEKDCIKMINPENLITRSQDLEETFHDAGQFYFFDVKKIYEKQKLITDNTGFIEISELDCQDIDNYSDWKLAELKYQMQNS